MHEVIASTIVNACSENNHDLLELFLGKEVDLVIKVAKYAKTFCSDIGAYFSALSTDEAVGYKGHSLLIANALAASTDALVMSHLKDVQLEFFDP